MPNAAKLVAAVGMAILAFIVTGMVKGLFDEVTNFGWFTQVNMVLGCLVGWKFLGSRSGRGMVSAINMGLTAPIVLVFWAIFVQSCNEMVRLAMKNRFDGPFEALVAIFEIGSEWALMIVNVPIWATLFVGGVMTGIAAEHASRNWR